MDILETLKNKDENMRLVKWMIKLARPYYKYIITALIISLVSMVIGYAGTIIGKYIVDDATNGEINIRNITFMGASTIISILVGMVSSILGNYISEKFSFSVRVNIYDDIQRSLWHKISGFHSEDIVTRLTSDVNFISDGLIGIIPSTFLIICQLLISFFILFHYDREIAVFALILGPIGTFVMLFFRQKYKKYQLLLRKSESEYRSFMQETLADLTVIKTFRMEDRNRQKMEEFKTKRLRLIFLNSRLSSIITAIMRLVYSLGYVVAFCWGSYRISKGEITYGTLTVFITLVSQVQGAVSNLAGVVPKMYSMLVSSKRICEVSENDKEVYSGKTDVPDSVALEIKNVSFSYDDNKPEIISDLSYSVRAGEKIGIIGPSGAGKTTLIRMLLALTAPTKGEMVYRFDSGRGEAVSPDSRRFIAYVPQGNTLMTGTIEENLKIGNKDATEEMMFKALKMASAYSFVNKLPDGLKTVLSEKSGGISEGQAQRIAIARAFISDKPVLILDEATSALDEENEAVILKNISDEYQDKTCFIITHRNSMLKYCDKVLKLSENS